MQWPYFVVILIVSQALVIVHSICSGLTSVTILLASQALVMGHSLGVVNSPSAE